MKPKISVITLGVSDLGKSLKFYKEGFGFKTHNYKESDGYVMFEMEGTWLALYPKDRLAKDATVANDSSGFSGITLSHNVKTKEDVDSVFEFMLSVGAKSVKKPQAVFWGGYLGYVSDPDGYLWEIAYNPITDLS